MAPSEKCLKAQIPSARAFQIQVVKSSELDFQASEENNVVGGREGIEGPGLTSRGEGRL